MPTWGDPDAFAIVTPSSDLDGMFVWRFWRHVNDVSWAVRLDFANKVVELGYYDLFFVWTALETVPWDLSVGVPVGVAINASACPVLSPYTAFVRVTIDGTPVIERSEILTITDSGDMELMVTGTTGSVTVNRIEVTRPPPLTEWVEG